MYKLFSQRIKDEEGNPEVYSYHFIEKFRIQFLHILKDVSSKSKFFQDVYYTSICETYAREAGITAVAFPPSVNDANALYHFLLMCNDVEFLDMFDLICSEYIDNSELFSYMTYSTTCKNLINEINMRLKQNSIGYEFCNHEIVIKTNEFAHENIIKPSLKLLLDNDFITAEQEFITAFSEYKRENNKQAIIEAAKAFESTMKIICDKCYGGHRENDTASKLLALLKANNFFPAYLEDYMNGLIKTLGSGVPTVRNKLTAHGQGSSVIDVPDEYVEYTLNAVATNMILLHKIYMKIK